jgi:hypothetical protein
MGTYNKIQVIPYLKKKFLAYGCDSIVELPIRGGTGNPKDLPCGHSPLLETSDFYQKPEFLIKTIKCMDIPVHIFFPSR